MSGREPERPDSARRWRRAFEGILGVPATEGNAIDVLRNGDQIFPAMLDAIRDATETVDFLTYVYWSGDVADAFAEALAERAQAGVRVRILLDAMGSATMNPLLIRDMRQAGCAVERFRPPTRWKIWETDHRTHRKVLVCDEDVAFTGGVGIAEEWSGDAGGPDEWRDTHFRIRGPAVDGLRSSFLSNWVETGRAVVDGRDRFPEQQPVGDAVVQVVRTPAQYDWTDIATVFRMLFELARTEVHLTTAYFAPDDALMERMAAAAARGVRIRILVPGRHADKRIVQAAGEDRFAELLDAGIEVHTYERTMLHAKVCTVDGMVSWIGSGNVDHRSMRLNAENNLLVYDEDVTRVLDTHFEEDLELAERVRPGGWDERSTVQRGVETVAALIRDRL